MLPHLDADADNTCTREQMRERLLTFLGFGPEGEKPAEKIELWGYYSSYDHVALAQIWGRMIDLPRGLPMYTRDLKQLCDELGNIPLPEQGKGEHNALADARWNRSAYRFLRMHALTQTKPEPDSDLPRLSPEDAVCVAQYLHARASELERENPGAEQAFEFKQLAERIDRSLLWLLGSSFSIRTSSGSYKISTPDGP